MLLGAVATEAGEEVGDAVVVGDIVGDVVGDIAVVSGEAEAETEAGAKLPGVGDVVATGDGETIGDAVVVGAIAVVVVVDATLLGLGEVVATTLGEAVGVASREAEGLTEGDKVAVGVGAMVGEAIVAGVMVSTTGVVAVSPIVAEEDSGVFSSLLAVVVELKTIDPMKVARITPHRANNTLVFISGDISSSAVARSAPWVNSGSEG
ncbi:MAG: hypothetical protein RSE13_12280 [Planktothrix sp. GU0601_MAG3]|nr:MAG: hypothetical protein RSE13_12280 [Planktothrix sp. GU0601_MAG3]